MLNPQHEDTPKEFLARIGSALLRVGALVVMGVIHYFLEKAMIYIIPENMPWAKHWLEDISFVIFLLIYVYLLWDMLKIFVPMLQSKVYPGLEAQQETHDEA